jgi:hypothetical protein
MNTKKTVICLAMVGLLASAPAMAVKPGFYLGASLGGASTEFEEGNVQIDENDFAWKLFAGFHFLQFFAVEGGYRDLGSPSTNVAGNDLKLSTTAWDVAGLAGIPLGPVYLFGKLGAVWWDSEVTVSGVKDSDDDVGFEAGIGASIDLWKIQLRGELEYLDIDEGALMYTVGAAWRF